jgi:hypothetical protein
VWTALDDQVAIRRFARELADDVALRLFGGRFFDDFLRRADACEHESPHLLRLFVELETMNEELQSTNEELQTVNPELRQRGTDLSRSNVFLGGILRSVRWRSWCSTNSCRWSCGTTSPPISSRASSASKPRSTR